MKTSILLFGSFCIAYNAANLLHELGHAVAVWSSGGQVVAITLNPFLWNYTFYANNPGPLFTSWGGILFGVVFAVALTALAFFIRSPFMAPLYVLAGCALAVNGIYFTVAAFADVGDAADLIRQGVPRDGLVVVGLVLLVASCLWTSLVQRLVGIRPEASFARRLLIMHLGVTPYLFLMGAYGLAFAGSEALLFLGLAAVGVLAVTGIALSGHLLRNVAARVPWMAPVEPTWTAAGVMLVFGVAVIIGELLLFPAS